MLLALMGCVFFRTADPDPRDLALQAADEAFAERVVRSPFPDLFAQSCPEPGTSHVPGSSLPVPRARVAACVDEVFATPRPASQFVDKMAGERHASAAPLLLGLA